jgi:mannose-6-phosphate isomerase-like protein (cupin superfamily)
METPTATNPTVLDADDITALPVEPLGALGGVTHRVLWRNDTSMAGVLMVEAGHHLGAHTHRANHHHMWVLEGHAQVLGRELDAGSYVHIPAGVEHDIDATATEGCTVYYLYLQPVTLGA